MRNQIEWGWIVFALAFCAIGVGILYLLLQAIYTL